MWFGLDVTWQHLQANTCSCEAHLHSFNFQSCMFQLSPYNQTLRLFRPSELDGVICYLLGCFSGSLLLTTLNNSNQLSKVVYLWRWLSLPPLLLFSLPPSLFSSLFLHRSCKYRKNPSLLWFRCSGGYKEQQTRSLSLSLSIVCAPVRWLPARTQQLISHSYSSAELIRSMQLRLT